MFAPEIGFKNRIYFCLFIFKNKIRKCFVKKKKIFIFNLMFPMRKTINGTTSVRLSWRQKRGMFAVLHCLRVFHSLLTNCCFDETLQRYNDRLSDWSSFFICLSFVLVYFLSASGAEKKVTKRKK